MGPIAKGLVGKSVSFPKPPPDTRWRERGVPDQELHCGRTLVLSLGLIRGLTGAGAGRRGDGMQSLGSAVPT